MSIESGGLSTVVQRVRVTESIESAPLSLRFRLLVWVNATLGILLAVALLADYRRELAHHLRHEKAALLAEAETIAAALPGLQAVDADSIRRLLDSVLAGMNATDAPRHRMLVEWKGTGHRAQVDGRKTGREIQFQTSDPSPGGKGRQAGGLGRSRLCRRNVFQGWLHSIRRRTVGVAANGD